MSLIRLIAGRVSTDAIGSSGIGIFEKVGLPDNTDIPAGSWGVFKDTSDGKCFVAVNDGGTIKSRELLE